MGCLRTISRTFWKFLLETFIISDIVKRLEIYPQIDNKTVQWGVRLYLRQNLFITWRRQLIEISNSSIRPLVPLPGSWIRLCPIQHLLRIRCRRREVLMRKFVLVFTFNFQSACLYAAWTLTRMKAKNATNVGCWPFAFFASVFLVSGALRCTVDKPDRLIIRLLFGFASDSAICIQ